ncbi:MAG: hypothetical protein ACI82A_003336 [Candidatus Azotimanducaceae bacterium]|jgi:hypothetical protein
MSDASELTKEEYIQLNDVVFSNANAQFELWLTITLAVIIAAYIAGNSLSEPLRILVAVLYLAVSTLLFLVFSSTFRFGAEMGGFGIYAEQGGLTVLVTSLRMFVWILGSIATLVFIFRKRVVEDGTEREEGT